VNIDVITLEDLTEYLQRHGFEVVEDGDWRQFRKAPLFFQLWRGDDEVRPAYLQAVVKQLVDFGVTTSEHYAQWHTQHVHRLPATEERMAALGLKRPENLEVLRKRRPGTPRR